MLMDSLQIFIVWMNCKMWDGINMLRVYWQDWRKQILEKKHLLCLLLVVGVQKNYLLGLSQGGYK